MLEIRKLCEEKEIIKPGMSLIDLRNDLEKKMLELGADSFWYWNVGAFVFAGDETTISVSCKSGLRD